MRNLTTILATLVLAVLAAGCTSVREKGPVTKKIHYPATITTVSTANGPQLIHNPDQYLLRHQVILSDGTTTEKDYYVDLATWQDAKVGQKIAP
jgi:hypothetical protein